MAKNRPKFKRTNKAKAAEGNYLLRPFVCLFIGIMAFQAKLPSGAVLKISNRDGQTHLSLQSDGNNQGSSVSSGDWKNSPTLFETSDGLVLKTEGDETHYTAIKDGSLQSLDSEPDLKDAKTLPLEKISDEDAEAPHMKPLEPMQPMKPMAPMKPMDS